MTAFREDGHLRDETLTALAENREDFDELERLEIAEHLAFCDACLLRYTALLEDEAALLVPERSCGRTLWNRIRFQALQATVSRCATAAAAVALALTVLWSGRGAELPRIKLPEDRPSISQQLSGLAGDLNDSLRQGAADLSDFFDGLRPGQFMQGGNDL